MFNGEEPDTDEELTDADAFLDCEMQKTEAEVDAKLEELSGKGMPEGELPKD